MLQHIDEAMAHFTTVHEWDVVNEPIEPSNGAPDNFRIGPGIPRSAVRTTSAALNLTTLDVAFGSYPEELGLSVSSPLL
jgi:hypothetical protein